MIRKPTEDLFQDTTMTFGEHLEELRGSLIKAVAGLVIGFLIGLLVANQVIYLIKDPLEKALSTYYRISTVEKYKHELEKEFGEGAPLPFSLEQVTTIVNTQNLLFDIVYMYPPDMAPVIRQSMPGVFDDVPAAPAEASSGATAVAEGSATDDAKASETTEVPELVPVLLWHRIADDNRIRVIGLNAQEAFVIWVKAAFVVGLILASPWVFYQIWSFVAAGLYPHEKRYVHVFLPFSLGLFLAGAGLAFFFVFEPVLDFLFSFNRWLGIDPDPRISEWLGFVLILPLGFGISFQLPLVMMFLERIGIFSAAIYLEKWRVAMLVIFIIAMLLTPADPYSMLLMAVPLTVLYFSGILLCKYFPKGKNPLDAAWESE